MKAKLMLGLPLPVFFAACGGGSEETPVEQQEEEAGVEETAEPSPEEISEATTERTNDPVELSRSDFEGAPTPEGNLDFEALSDEDKVAVLDCQLEKAHQDGVSDEEILPRVTPQYQLHYVLEDMGYSCTLEEAITRVVELQAEHAQIVAEQRAKEAAAVKEGWLCPNETQPPCDEQGTGQVDTQGPTPADCAKPGMRNHPACKD